MSSRSAESVAAKRPTNFTIVIIDSRALERECFASAIEAVQPKTVVGAFASVNDWVQNVDPSKPVGAILYNVEGRRISDPKVKGELEKIVNAARPVPVVVLSTFEEMSEMIATLDCGASGYIPGSLGVEATLAAVRLAGADAIFLPASSVLALRETLARPAIQGVENYFTPRQASVAEALRRGKSNKVIAYELNMCESTVKVHIRNIMKKLGASNRTEAGFKLHNLLPQSSVEPEQRRERVAGSIRIVS